MIPSGYVNALYAWAVSPELSDEVRSERATALIAERDALVTGALSGGKGVRDVVAGSVNGKSFQKDSLLSSTLSPTEKLTVLNEVLQRLGLVAEDAMPVSVTHAVFPCLQR